MSLLEVLMHWLFWSLLFLALCGAAAVVGLLLAVPIGVSQ